MPRLPLAFLAVLALLSGVLAGLARAGWEMPAFAVAQVGRHAALMIAVFFGTVIGLERAVALGRLWPYFAPLFAGLAGLAMLAWLPPMWAPVLLTAAASVFVCGNLWVLVTQPTAFAFVLLLGGASWLAGNLLWLVAGDASAALSWWFAFLVLTIAGERLELTRLVPMSAVARLMFFACVAVILAGCVATVVWGNGGWRVFATGLVALAAWLAKFDVARRNAGQQGLTRYIAVCLLSGYVWLAVAGLAGLAGGFESGHAWHDAAIHALALGFVFAMVFGHAPIILPAVARVKVGFHPVFYIPLALLHLTLAWRVGGAMANALTLLTFVGVMAFGIARGRMRVSLPPT